MRLPICHAEDGFQAVTGSGKDLEMVKKSSVNRDGIEGVEFVNGEVMEEAA